ncbi:class I SAM-dependent methyltransferase [Dactylosporangium sp. CA-233914]|uniref:class I SAM-dependent methyltransferase n=1 Tax=Dactylosporangium sp. CA-233914 TaxID=3239934 RepID=UPI003D8DCF99
MSTTTPGTTYAFDNDNPHAADQHAYLPAILDPGSQDRIAGLAWLDLDGARCWEIGAGAGTIAGWLAGRVGPAGTVLATDINPRHIQPQPNLVVQRRDIAHDPLPEGPFDLIFSRLCFTHVPTRHTLLPQVADRLAPGGALVIDEWETGYRRGVLTATDPRIPALYDRYQDVLIGTILAGNGHDPNWASDVHAAMVSAGLVDVNTTVTARSWNGGTPGALLVTSNLQHLKPQFLANGFTEDDIAVLTAGLQDPATHIRGNLTVSTVGRRPAA